MIKKIKTILKEEDSAQIICEKIILLHNKWNKNIKYSSKRFAILTQKEKIIVNIFLIALFYRNWNITKPELIKIIRNSKHPTTEQTDV
jgi:hypothetical protein